MHCVPVLLTVIDFFSPSRNFVHSCSQHPRTQPAYRVLNDGNASKYDTSRNPWTRPSASSLLTMARWLRGPNCRRIFHSLFPQLLAAAFRRDAMPSGPGSVGPRLVREKSLPLGDHQGSPIRMCWDESQSQLQCNPPKAPAPLEGRDPRSPKEAGTAKG